MRIFPLIVPAILIAAVLALANSGSARAEQPVSLWLPWQGGSLWTYTQGPHGDGFEALDFQPPDAGGRGCDGFLSSFWVTAAADGIVSIRANGVEISHGDGFGTGYYHLGNIQVEDGDEVVAGEPLGNAGCCPDGPVEGCWATGPHLHFYTLYDGARQPAAGINLGGWFVRDDGCLTRNEQTICADSWLVSNTPDVVGAFGPADIVVLLDTSWSAMLESGDAERADVALALLQAARDDDRVSVINFNTRADVRSPLQKVATDDRIDPSLAEAVQMEEDFGRTDLKVALTAACRELLVRGESNARAVVLVSDGRDTVGRAEGAETCLAHHGIPVYTYRLGEDDSGELLEDIAEATGGGYKPLADVHNLYCEFRLVRALISGDPPGRCSALRIEPGDVLSLPFNIPEDQDTATLEIRWRQRELPGNYKDDTFTIRAEILAPSHAVLPAPYPGIVVEEDAGSIAFQIVRPVAGTWSLTVSGENVPEAGVYVIFSGTTIPQAPPAALEVEVAATPSAKPTDPPSDTPEATASPAPLPTRGPVITPAPEPRLTPQPTRPVPTREPPPRTTATPR
jgi:hypothetical protein